MEVGLVGLGRMGANMAKRWLQHGHRVVGFDPDSGARRAVVEAGGMAVASLEELVAQLSTPRTVWVMVPSGQPAEITIAALGGGLHRGDLIIDGGNCLYTDSQRRARELAEHGVGFLDCGTSGGVWGLQEGYCLMVGGEAEAFARAEPLFASLAPTNGYLHVGPAGAGHFTKMVHNGIEYGMLQAYAEGFELMAAHELPLNLAAIAELWLHGSVVRSWLLELASDALRKDPGLEGIRGYVEDSGEGRWTVQEAVRLGVPVPALAFALFERFRSREADAFGDRFIAALRKEFGGHAVRPTSAQ